MMTALITLTDGPASQAFVRALHDLQYSVRNRPRRRQGLKAAEAYLTSLFYGDLRFVEPKLDPNLKRLVRMLFVKACDTFSLEESKPLPGQRRPWYTKVAQDVASGARPAASRRGWRHH